GLVNEGCSWAPHSWRQSKTVPSESTICPKSSWAGVLSGRPSSDWYHLKLWGTSATPMIVHVRFIGSSAAFASSENGKEADAGLGLPQGKLVRGRRGRRIVRSSRHGRHPGLLGVSRNLRRRHDRFVRGARCGPPA